MSSWQRRILALALLLRSAVVCATLLHYSPKWFFGQASELGCLAESLRSGRGLSSPFGGATGPSAFLAPGYPALVALIFRVFGSFTSSSAAALMVLQMLFSVTTVFVVIRIARRLFDDRIANVAGLIWACSPPLLFLPLIFWDTTLSVLFATSLVALTLAASNSPSQVRSVVFGAVCILSLTVNPALLTIIVPLCCWTGYHAPRKSRGFAGATMPLCFLLLAAWSVRNWHELHAFIPMRSNMGYELWQGNRPGASGFFSPALHPNVNAPEFHRYATLGEFGYMREKSAMSMQTIRNDPARFLALTSRRIFSFWTGISANASRMIILYASTTTLLGAFGFVLLARDSRRLALLIAMPLIFFPLPYYITHPDFRFRVVLDPLLTVLAAYAIVSSFRTRTPNAIAYR